MTEHSEDDEPSDCMFDEFRTLGGDHRQALLDALQPDCDQGRQRQRNDDNLEKLGLTLELVVANVLYARQHPSGPACFYSRGKGSYTPDGTYNPPWLTYRILIDNVIDKLVAAGWLEGQVSRPTEFVGAPRSTVRATDRLVHLARDLGIQDDQIRLDMTSAPVLILKGPKVDGRKPLLPYDRDAPEVLELDGPVRDYNIYIQTQDLGWTPPDDVWADLPRRTDSNGRPRRPPDVRQCFLRRIFNNGRLDQSGRFYVGWDQSGRFYGGWWQTVPSGTRKFITINGQPTIELDYSTFMPRAIYHSQGIDYPDDAYDIPEIKDLSDRQGLDWKDVIRPSIKTMFAVIVNSSSRNGRKVDKGIILPDGISIPRGYDLIEQHHLPISDWFYQGQGMELMYRESRVCQKILTAGVRSGEPILPVHDSFVVSHQSESWLKELMDQSYFEEFELPPEIH